MNLEEIKRNKELVIANALNAMKQINKIDNIPINKEVLFYEFPDQPMLLIPISDPHLGSKMCNLKKLAQVLEVIQKTPNCYTLFLGDNMEVATKTSVGLGLYEEDFHLDDQMVLFDNILKPLVAQNKVLAMITGNHEMRISNFAKLNPTEYIAKENKIPYMDYSGLMNFKVGDISYDVAIHHGVGGGSSTAGKIQSMRKQSKVVQADLYLSGHTHGKLSDSDLIYYIDQESKSMKAKKQHYAVCGSFLEYWGGYAEMKSLTPSETGALSFVFNNKEKEIEII